MKQGILFALTLISAGLVCGQLDSIGINFPVLAGGLVGMFVFGGMLVECGRK